MICFGPWDVSRRNINSGSALFFDMYMLGTTLHYLIELSQICKMSTIISVPTFTQKKTEAKGD